MGAIRANLQAVSARIARAAQAAGRDPHTVRVLAVSKTHSAAHVDEAYHAGQIAFGENYVQEALGKMRSLARLPLEWHLIGPLQSNKARLAAERFAWVQSVASERVARRLSESRSAEQAPLNVLVQVNISGEASKSGVEPAALRALAHVVAGLPRLRLRGLMAIPEPTADIALQRTRFGAARRCYELLAGEGLALDTLSLGMSDDLEAAIAEGSTMVRIGTAIFGPRATSAARSAASGAQPDDVVETHS